MEKTKRRRNKGLFITIEGGEGTGKTTLIDRLAREIKGRGFPLIQTREPGGTELGRRIRKLLLEKNEMSVGSRAELFLFLADRSEHVEEVILPALSQDKIVLCDRFSDSTLAYQGAARMLDLTLLPSFCSFAAHDLLPDLTLFLDLDPSIGFKRMQEKMKTFDRIEEEEIAFHQRVREAFLSFGEKKPERFYIIDANCSVDEVFQKAIEEIDAAIR